MFRLLLFFPFVLSGLQACSSSTEPAKSAVTLTTNSIKGVVKPSSQTSPVVAKVGSEAIDLKELDNAIQFSLFDLEWRKYQLRKDMLNRMVAQRKNNLSNESTESSNSEILLNPPKPPRISLPHDNRPIKGKQDALVLMSVFCSYQSSHCARLQPIIKQLEGHYGEIMAFNFYDLPQGFHRYGIAAANAYHCAEAAGVPWPYQSALYSDTSKLDNQRFINIAEQLNLDLISFESCLNKKTYLKTIQTDIDMAAKLGLGSVPVVFVNGLYAKGPQKIEAYRYYVDQELAQLGHVLKPERVKEQTLAESQLPMSLLATTVSNNEATSTAFVKVASNEQGAHYKAGDLMFEQVRLVKIEAQRILIENQGKLEFVKLQSSKGYDADVSKSISVRGQQSENLVDRESTYDADKLRSEMTRRELPATGEMTLSKNWLENQLINQAQLEEHFYHADHVVEGYHLVKLDEITDQRFYSTLGFKSDDVLLRVNNQWVHEGQNPLWDSLATEEQVTVVIMRGGYPVRYDYYIK